MVKNLLCSVSMFIVAAYSGLSVAQDAMFVDSSGNVGIGTNTPTSALHIQRNSDAQLRIQNGTSTPGQRVMLQLVNQGKNRFSIVNTDAGENWTFDNSGTSFDISRVGSGVAEFRVMNNGDGRFHGDVFAGGVNLSSSRALKTDFSAVDEVTILSKVGELEVSQWRYLREPKSERHIGPTAEAFANVFGLGDGEYISAVDANGVLFAAAKALRLENGELKTQMFERKQEIERLESKVAELEALEDQVRSMQERLRTVNAMLQ